MSPQHQEPKSATRLNRLLVVLTVALVVLLAARRLYRAPYDASDLRITPDEIEYAVSAHRVATLGSYSLEIDGRAVAPHSTPWFATFVLAPAYLIAPEEIGNGIWPVLLFAIAGVVLLQRVGERIAGPLAGAVAALAVLAMPGYSFSARLIMTDMPAAVVGFATLLLYLRTEDSAKDTGERSRVRESLLAGVLIAAAFAMRSVYLALLLPFAWRLLRQRERAWRPYAALLGPLAAVLAANACYNQSTFGDWRRTGYQYWRAVPYDYVDLLLSPAYFPINFGNLVANPGVQALLALALVGAVILLARRTSNARPLLLFAVVSALPMSGIQLVYAFGDTRFHVFGLTLAALIAGVGVASLAPVAWRSNRWLALATLVVAFFFTQPPPTRRPVRRLAADAIHATTPVDAVIISGLEPAYLQAVAPADSRRTYVAASREVEFASKLLVERRIPRSVAAPLDATNYRAPGLLAAGAQEAIARTADEMPDQIAEWVRAGRAVFVDTKFLADETLVERICGSSLTPHPVPGAKRLARLELTP